VDENYIAVSQDAAWLGYSPVERNEVQVNKKIRLLRALGRTSRVAGTSHWRTSARQKNHHGNAPADPPNHAQSFP